MNDTMSMGMIECFGNIGGDLQRLLNAQLLLPIDLVSEGIAFDVGRDEEQESVGFARIVGGAGYAGG